jgi:hypothetical protein
MLIRGIAAVPLVVALFACGSIEGTVEAKALAKSNPLQQRAAADGRLLIRSASLSIEVEDAEKAADAATRLVGAAGGLVDSSQSSKEGAIELVVRVPEAQLDDVLHRFADLGDVTGRSLTATDVTDEVVDLDARMRNLVATRDSLRKLLERATSVQDVVAVERELSRVQGDIDAMEAKLKSLRSRVALSEIDLDLHRKKILGPIGVIGKGAWWLVSKLFVFRE